MTRISSLTLTSFRNYESVSINYLDSLFVILIGDNGAGKTNALEGLSALSPGRGLRGARVMDMQSQEHAAPWAVSVELMDNDGDTTRLGVGRNPDRPDKKIIKCDGELVKNQNDLGDILRTIWLTPQMDGLFLQGVSDRLRFFDRLVATFDPAHAGRLNRYDKATRERLNILRDDTKTPDAIWLSALETIMAETSVAIGAGRVDMLGYLRDAMDGGCDFPDTEIHLNGDVEIMLGGQSALSVEDMIREKLEYMRNADAQTGRTNFGVGRTDMVVTFTDKNANAAQCSTGEQKALLTSIILAHARMVLARFGAPPLLLFDEVTAHFDSRRRDALFEILADLGGQVWLTGQDVNAFNTIKNKKMIEIKNNQFEVIKMPV